MRLKDKVAIITGAARGIGAATAELFTREGARVLLTDVLPTGAETAKKLGESARYEQHDVRDEKQWQRVVDVAMKHYGKIDILVNNAGIGGVSFEIIETMPLEKAQQTLDINVIGTFLGIKTIIPAMRKTKGGSIINISSTAAQLGMNSLGIYGASKAAISALTKVAAMELGQHNIRINSIHPGGANTKMGNFTGVPIEEFNKQFGHSPMQRACEPSEIASGILFFASDDSVYCTGSELLVDGGQAAGLFMSFLPGHPKMPSNKFG